MKKIILLSTITLLTTLACKKSTPASTTPASTTSTGGYNAILTEFRYQSVTSGTLSSAFNQFDGQFYSVPTTSTNYTAEVSVNNVSLNGVVLKWSNPGYADTTFSISCPPGTWVINGANGIPSFTYTNNNPIPSFSGYASWPDTIYRNHNAVIPMTGVSGADLITVMVSDGTVGTSQQMALTGTSVNFTSAQTSTLTATNNGTLSVLLDKSNVQNISGKSMNFLNAYELAKTVVIK